MSALPVIEVDGLKIVDVPPPPGANDDDVAPVDFTKPLIMRDGKLEAAKPAKGISFEDIIERWRRDGALVHESTPFDAFNRLTNGGPVYGTRMYVNGPPDVSKTLFLAQLADVWARRGIAVGFLSVDEESDDLFTRFCQRIGITRSDCEQRNPATLAQMEVLNALPIRVFEAEDSIEAAAEGLVKFKEGRGLDRAVLFVDSIQVCQCRATQGATRELSKLQIVTENVRAIRAMATKHRLIIIGTSEVGREFYRDPEKAKGLNKMAAAKESGAVEYAARIMINISDEDGLIKFEVVKNKHGGRGEFYATIDRDAQKLDECGKPVDATPRKVSDAFIAQCQIVLDWVIKNPGVGTKKRRAGLRALKFNGVKISEKDAEAALEALCDQGKIREAIVKPPVGREGPAYFPVDGVTSVDAPAPPSVGMAADDGTDLLRDYVES